jgi:hypothetical protein
MTGDSELDRIDPEPVEVKLSTGFTVEIARMKTRQFFRLLRVLTHGAGPALTQSQLDFAGDPGEFGRKLLTLIVMSIPDAESEAIMFLSSMCRPAGLTDKQQSQMTKQETEANQAAWDKYGAELHNPELTDLLDLIEVIVKAEAGELQALGKKLQRTMDLFAKTGQDKEPAAAEPGPRELNSPEPSPPPSTPSPTSTGGPTSTSSDFPSAASARPSRRRAPAGTGNS